MTSWKESFAWILLFLLVAGLFQIMMPAWFDEDTGYHLAIARLTWNNGVLQAFPWTPFSWLATHYADKELFFHFLLIPFSSLEPVWASRLVGTFLGGLVLSVLYFILRIENVSKAGIWTFVALASSSAFIARWAMVRPHLVSIALALLITWTATRNKKWPLYVLMFLFPFWYTAWHLPLVLLGIVVTCKWCLKAPGHWSTVGLAVLSLGLGILVHPNFPDNVRLFWIQNVDVLMGTAWAGKAGISLGGEFRPFSVSGVGRYLLFPLFFLVWSIKPAWNDRKVNPFPLISLVTGWGFAIVTLLSQRFVEYLAPFAVLTLAMSWKVPKGKPWVAVLLAACVGYILLLGQYPLNLMRGRTDMIPSKVRKTLQGWIPREAQVVTCDWEFTGSLMLSLPERKFLVALDPMFFAVKDPERYRIWYETVRRPPKEGAALLLRDTFNAQYVLCTTDGRWRSFLENLAEDTDARFVGGVGHWRAFMLRPRDMER